MMLKPVMALVVPPGLGTCQSQGLVMVMWDAGLCLCVSVCAYECHSMHIEGNLWETVLSFHRAGSGGGTRVTWLCSECLYSLAISPALDTGPDGPQEHRTSYSFPHRGRAAFSGPRHRGECTLLLLVVN